MTVDEAQVKLCDYIALITGREVIFGHDNGPQPKAPYISVVEKWSGACCDYRLSLNS